MNKRSIFRKGALLLLAALLFVGCGSSQKKSQSSRTGSIYQTEGDLVEVIKKRGYIVVGCKMDVPDMGYYDQEKDEWSGLEVDLAYETAAKIFDVTVEEAKSNSLVHFTGVTVANREDKLLDGEIDLMLATFTITEARARIYTFSNSYYRDYIGLLVLYTENNNSLGTSGEIRSIANLDGKYVAVAENSTTREDMLEYLNTMNSLKVSPIFCVYSSYQAMFKALKKGDVDVMSVDVSILKGYVDHETKILDDRFASQEYGAAVRQGDESLIDIVNQVIAEHK